MEEGKTREYIVLNEIKDKGGERSPGDIEIERQTYILIYLIMHVKLVVG